MMFFYQQNKMFFLAIFFLAGAGALLFSAAPAKAGNCGGSYGVCSCGDTVMASTTLTLSDPVTQGVCASTALTIGTNNVVLNGGGMTLTGNGSSNYRGVYALSRSNTTIKNFANITNFYFGIFLSFLSIL